MIWLSLIQCQNEPTTEPDFRARKISDDVFNSSIESEGGSPLLMTRRDLPVMSPLVRNQNGSISEVFFSRRSHTEPFLNRQRAIEDESEPRVEQFY